MFIGIMMVAHDNDILERVLEENTPLVDAFYVLDGTTPNDESKRICWSFGGLAGYTHDTELPRPPYPEGTTCGYRNWPLQQAVEDYGWDHWFLLLHGDEVWTRDPRSIVAQHPEADGFMFRLPFYFPRDPWDYDVHALDQLQWHMKPGWPEFRMFHGNQGVAFDPNQHFDTRPSGIKNVAWCDAPIKHYPYRSPEVQRERAKLHERTGFDLDNYRHIIGDDAVYWTPAMIENAKCEHHSVVACDQTVPLW